MLSKTVALSLFTAIAAVQAADNSTSLPDLVSQLPTCVIPCYEQGATAAGCSTTDFACLCGDNKEKFISSAGTCALTKCGNQLSDIVSLATQICTAVADNPDTADVASASAIVTSALGAATATSSSNPDSTDAPGAAGLRSEVPFGILGAALAMLVL